MDRVAFTSVDEYIAAQPRAVQPILLLVRSAIRKAVPKAEEGISYKMPAYTLDGEPLLYFAGWKQHYSLYPVSERLVAECKSPAVFDIRKSTIRFPIAEPVPVKFIEQIAKLRASGLGANRRG